jgi:hypothetical protein
MINQQMVPGSDLKIQSSWRDVFSWEFFWQKRVHKLLRWEVPHALPSEMFGHTSGEMTWESWSAETKSKYPIRFFVLQTAPSVLGSWWFRVDQRWYWFQSVTYKKRHLLDLRQPKDAPYDFAYRYGWCDVDSKIIYANFNLLVQFVDKELGGPQKATEDLKWLKENNAPPFQCSTIEEALRLYKWWKEDRLIRIEEVNAARDDWHNNRHAENSRELLDKSSQAEQDFELEINDKLKALIDIRQGLWT